MLQAPTPAPARQAGGAPPSHGIFSTLLRPLWATMNYLNSHVMYLNSSKFFAGIIMILLNVGSKFITIQFSKSTEEYMKYTVSKQLLVFAMAWMGTRDIYAAFGLTAIFTILSEHLFNEESRLCIVPQKYRVVNSIADTGPAANSQEVSEVEYTTALQTIERAKREKMRGMQRSIFMSNFYPTA